MTKIILFVAVLLGIVLFLVLDTNPKGLSDTKIKDTNQLIEKGKSETQAKNATDTTIESNLPLAPISTSTIEAKLENGIKARNTTVTLKDELYTDEFVLHKEESISIEPTPIRPKQSFVKWVLQFSGSVAGGIVASDEKLFFGTYDNQAFIVEAKTGALLSRTTTISQPVSSTIAHKGLFLIPQRNGQVTAYSMLDGKEKWNHRSAVDKPTTEIDLSISCIAVYDNKFYVSKFWGNLYIGNADSGILEQDVGVTYESRINLPAIKTNDGILFCNVAGELHCFKDDGKENWHYTIPKGYLLSMHLFKNTLFLATTEKELMALDLNDRKIIWVKELAGYAFDSITSTNDILYIQAKDIYAIDPKTSKTLWQISSKSSEGFCRGPITFSENTLFATEQNGRLISANLNTGTQFKDFDFKETIRNPLKIAEDLLFLSTTSKRIYAVEISKLK